MATKTRVGAWYRWLSEILCVAVLPAIALLTVGGDIATSERGIRTAVWLLLVAFWVCYILVVHFMETTLSYRRGLSDAYAEFEKIVNESKKPAAKKRTRSHEAQL